MRMFYTISSNNFSFVMPVSNIFYLKEDYCFQALSFTNLA
jgi:hypothetical protein